MAQNSRKPKQLYFIRGEITTNDQPIRAAWPSDRDRFSTSGIQIEHVKRTGMLHVSGWFDSFVGIQGGSIPVEDFISKLGIEPWELKIKKVSAAPEDRPMRILEIGVADAGHYKRGARRGERKFKAGVRVGWPGRCIHIVDARGLSDAKEKAIASHRENCLKIY